MRSEGAGTAPGPAYDADGRVRRCRGCSTAGEELIRSRIFAFYSSRLWLGTRADSTVRYSARVVRRWSYLVEAAQVKCNAVKPSKRLRNLPEGKHEGPCPFTLDLLEYGGNGRSVPGRLWR